MSVKQELLDKINADISARDALSYEEYIKNAKKRNEANKLSDINTLSAGYDSQISNTKAVYEKEIGDTKAAYEDAYQKNAVQKLINEKQIAEVNANLGLTDSGLNRTQQTAAQLSYANQKGKIDIARQSALDELGLSLANAVTTLQNEKASGIRDIENQWDNISIGQATDEYNVKIGSYNESIKNYADNLKEIEKNEQDIAHKQWEKEQDIAHKQWEAQQDAQTEIEKYKQNIEYKQWEKGQDIAYKQWEAQQDAQTEIEKYKQNIAYKQWEAQQDAQTEIEKDQKSTSYGAGGTSNGGYIISNKNNTLSRDYMGSLKDNGVSTVYSYNEDGTIKSVTYIDSNSNMSSTFDAGVNPYTGKMHEDLRNKDGYYDQSKAFDNGYQPNNIGGKKLNATDAKAEIYEGHLQTIFELDGNYYVWDGGKNKYIKLTKEQVQVAFPDKK